MTTYLASPDTVRYVAAGVALAVLLLLAAATSAYGHRLAVSWQAVLWATTAQEAALAYAAVTRARTTPQGFPQQTADSALWILLVAGLGLLIAVVAVFVAHRGEDLGRE